MWMHTRLAVVGDYAIHKDGIKYNLEEGHDHVLFNLFV